MGLGSDHKTSHGQPADILLVEDDPHDAEMTLAALRECGLAHRVEHVNDGPEALDYIFAPKQSPTLPKLILLDLNLKKMGGLHVLRQLKADERVRAVPVVVLSGSKTAIEVLSSYKLGVNSFVIKPMEGKKFAATVAAIGHYWLAINELPQG
ncbi:MAG TPA: response regulator [Candidatus Dormibacteraeota bacterium]|nr:response regulator [Candidatus Dormibacteraeota bacterium]